MYCRLPTRRGYKPPLGAIDCSHVKIQSPGGDNAETFRNRNQCFSFSVQTIADAALKIMDIVARWPGASHDAYTGSPRTGGPK
jgi:hypothetical protein